MSTPGWYPDPGGRAGHYRLWDGQAWGLSTSTEPPGGPASGPPPPRRPRRTPWIVAGVIVLVLVAVVAALVLGPGRPVATPTPTPAVTEPGSQVQPTSAAPTRPSPRVPRPTTTSAVPSETASVAPSGATPTNRCPIGDPFARQDHPRDGRVHGGSLSFPRQPGWEDPGPQASAFTWAYDLGETDIRLEQNRYASYAVGAVSVADGFEDPRAAARLMMECTIGSALYGNVSSRTDLVDEETTVDGYRAWSLRSEVRTYDSQSSDQGDTVQITVVDLDSPEALAFFWGSAPIGDQTYTDRLDEVVDELRVG